MKTTKRAKKKKEVLIRSPSVPDEELKPGKKTKRPWMSWLGWGLVYIVVFYLGNLSGEYVAAHMPLNVVRLPRVTFNLEQLKKIVPVFRLPQVSFSFNRDKLPKFVAKTDEDQKVTNTKTVIVAGKVLAVPLDGATEDEKAEFYTSIDALAQDETTISVSQFCELNPAFIRASRGFVLNVTNTSQKTHEILVNTKKYSIGANATVPVSIEDKRGAYVLSCDGLTAGYFISKE